MRPLEVLDQQVDLIRWWRSPEGLDFGEHFAEAGAGLAENISKHGVKPNPRIIVERVDGDTSVDPRLIGAEFARMNAQALDRGDTFAVADSMTEMIFRASQTIPADPLREWDLPSRSGFVVFNRSIWDEDIHGNAISWRAASWHPAITHAEDRIDGNRVVDGIAVTFYTDTQAPDVRETDTAIADLIAEMEPGTLPRYLALHTAGYGFGTEWGEEAWDIEHGGGMHSSVAIARRVMTAFWAISQQYVGRVHRVPADRALRRRIERQGLLTDLPKEVRVVTLRKVHDTVERLDPDGPPVSVPWSHRWLVSGHWRNQWYPKDSVHRRIWIDEFEKGPEGLPLVVKDEVYRVSR